MDIVSILSALWLALEPFFLWILLGVILAIVVLIMFLRWIMNKWFKRQPVMASPVSLPTKFDVLDCIPVWFKNLRGDTPVAIPFGKSESPDVAPDVAVPDFSETLLIGLGPVGREILSQMVTVLNSRWKDGWRKNIHLLQVDVQMPETMLDRPQGMKEREWVLLTPNFEEIKDMLRNPTGYRVDVSHWDWYNKTAVEDENRAIGRMALFDDLKNGRGKFWNALETAMQGFADPNIRIIGATFDNISSGILIDVARLTKLITNNVDMQLWLTGAFQTVWMDYSCKQPLSVDDQKLRTLATLREIERSQSSTRMLYTYVPKNNRSGQLKQYFDDSVTQRIFLFEQLQNEAPTDVFDSMLDALLVMFHKEVTSRVTRQLRAKDKDLGDIITTGNGAAIAIGTYSFHLTSGLVESASAWRMIRDLFFEQEYGLKPLEKSDQRSGVYQKLDRINPPSLRMPDERELIDDWLTKLERTQRTDSFVTHVADYVSKILNGEIRDGSIEEKMRFRQYAFDLAERWLKLLETSLRADGQTQLARQVSEFQKEIVAWNTWLEHDLYPVCVTELGRAQDKLQRLRLRSRRESDIPESLEWATYLQDIRPSKIVTQRESADKMPLMRFATRFGWQVVYDNHAEQWQLRFVAPPRSFRYSEDGKSPQNFAFARYELSNMTGILYDLAYSYTLVGKENYSASEVLAAQVNKGTSLRAWLEKARPGLDFNQTVAATFTGNLVEMTTLAAPKDSNSDVIQPLLDALVSADQMGEEKKSEDLLSDTGNDTEMVSLLRLKFWIPFNTLKMYDREQRSAVVPASYYVWPSEQLASDIEKGMNHRFSNVFISKLAQDYEWVSAFGLVLIYGLHEEDDQSWEMPGWHETIRANTAWHLLQRTLNDIPDLQHPSIKRQEILDLWGQLIVERRENTGWLEKYKVASLYDWLTQAEDILVKPFRGRYDDVILQDWAVFLGYLIKQEKNK